MDPTENLPDDTDLTVLAYLRKWVGEQFKTQEKQPVVSESPVETPVPVVKVKPIFWGGLILVVFGQFLFGIENQTIPAAAIVVILAGMVCIWLGLPREMTQAEARKPAETNSVMFQIKPIWLAAALILSAVSFLIFRDNHFGWLQTLSWLTATACAVYAFWPARRAEQKSEGLKLWQDWRNDWPFLCLVLAVAVTGMVFRLKDLNGLPPEVISAQVESYYSVSEISQGNNYVFFTRNAVPEPLNYYWSYLVNLFSGKTLSMTTLRLANSLAGLIGVVFVYGLGKLAANRWVGLTAAGLAGCSYWLVLQERATIGGGLVFPLMAIALYGLFKGLEEQDGRFYLLAAVAAGLGLMSNKIFLIFPLAAVIALLIWRSQNKQVRPQLMWGLVGIGLLVSIVAVIPLVGAVSTNPEQYLAPILARIGEYEVAYSGNPVLIFLNNFLKALGIVNWTNTGSWVDSLSGRGAVDGLTAIFFLVGIVCMVKDYRVGKDWKLLTILLLYPILLLPSALVLAFPAENPSMTRAVGAAIPVMVIAAYGISGLFRLISSVFSKKTRLLQATLIGLIFVPVAAGNYNLVFTEYAEKYKNSAWNASEIADVIQRFYSSGKEGMSYLISYPYWVDSRAVAISMGQQAYNLSLPVEQIESTVNVSLPKLFILNPMDKDSIAKLQAVYPEGVISTYQTVNPDKNFILFIVGQ